MSDHLTAKPETDNAAAPWAHLLPKGTAPDFDPPPTTINAMFANTVARHPDVTFIDYVGERHSYAAMARKVRAIAAALQREGLGKGDVVALYLPNCPWHPAWFFGALAAGCVVTHLSPLDAPQELAFKVRDSGARLIVALSSQPFRDRASELVASGLAKRAVICRDAPSLNGGDHVVPNTMLSFETFIEQAESSAFEAPVVQPEDLALLQYTGGTTGRAKAAMLTHRNLTASAQIYSAWFQGEPHAGPGKSVLVYSPLFHILGLNTNLIRRMAEGGMIFLRQRFDAAEAIDLIERHRISAFGGVPTIWIAITQLPDIESRDLSSLTYAGSGGAPAPLELIRRVRRLTGLTLRGGWGMTETSPAGANIPTDVPEAKRATIGVPLPGVRIEIVAVDDPRRVLGVGEAGEMRIKGPNVTAGYWNRPEETQAAFVDGWFLTGDIAWMDEQGYLFFVDRKKDLIISAGFNVYPLAVEEAIAAHPDVVETLVIGVPDAYRGESAKAFIVLREGASPMSLDELRLFLKDRLGPHELPRELTYRTHLPRTGVGKPSRRALRAQELAARQSSPTPRSE